MRKGFTIVELLIVIVVIAILAAIAILAFNGMQERARSSQNSSALSQAQRQLQLYSVDNGSYPLSGNVAAAGVENGDVTYEYTSDGSAYCLTATSGTTSNYIEQSGSPNSGACAGHANGGVATITNIVTNPSAYSSNAGWYRWNGPGGATSWALVDASWATRNRAYEVTWTQGTTSPGSNIQYRFTSGLEPNTEYTAHWKVYLSRPQQMWSGVYNWKDGLGNNSTGTNDSRGGNNAVPANTPVSQWLTFTTGEDTVSGRLQVLVSSGAGGGTNWQPGDTMAMSDLIVTEGSTVHNFADGESNGWVWNGTPDASTSTGPAL